LPETGPRDPAIRLAPSGRLRKTHPPGDPGAHGPAPMTPPRAPGHRPSPALSVVVLEDRDDLRQLIAEQLTDCGCQVREADSLVALNRALLLAVPNVLLLDLNLPDAEGLELLRCLRRAHVAMGVVVITGRHKGSDRAQAYEYGADVFLRKPFDLAELLAVVQSLGRRVLASPAVVEHGALVLSVERGTLQAPDGVTLRLSPTDASLLQVLATAPVQGLSVDDLLACLGKDDPDDRDRQHLRLMVHRLRIKLAAHARTADMVRSVRAMGYRLTTALQVV
jgi:DNA-binding response OmpR family regulator